MDEVAGRMGAAVATAVAAVAVAVLAVLKSGRDAMVTGERTGTVAVARVAAAKGARPMRTEESMATGIGVRREGGAEGGGRKRGKGNPGEIGTRVRARGKGGVKIIEETGSVGG